MSSQYKCDSDVWHVCILEKLIAKEQETHVPNCIRITFMNEEKKSKQGKNKKDYAYGKGDNNTAEDQA